jgi:iron complex outermembrane receptor protein
LDLPEFAKVSAKLTYMNSSFDGWVHNPGTAGDFGGKDQEGFRIALRWRPLDALTVDYTYDRARQGGVSPYEQNAYKSLELGFVFPLQPDRVSQSWRPVDLPVEDSFVASGQALTAAWDVSETVTLKSITAYRDLKATEFHDTTEAFNLPVVIYTSVAQHQFSQEGLLTGSAESLGLKYTLGGFYFTETGGMRNAGIPNQFSARFYAIPYIAPTLADIGTPTPSGADNESAGAYANVSWTPPVLDERLSLILGGRYSSDDRGASNLLASAHTSYTSFDPSVTIDFKWTDKLHTYAKYAKGYRSGGFNLYNSALSPFGPEQLRSYEIGLKSLWWNDRLQVNLDGYIQNYKAIQLDFVDPLRAGGAGGGIATVNAGKADFRGVEGDFELMPVDGLTLTANFAYMDAAWAGGSNTIANPFGGPPLVGVSLPNAPRWKYDLGAEYALPPFSFGTLSALIGYSYRGSETSNGGPGTSGDVRPSYGLVNARVTLSDIGFARGNLAVSMWANNLTDEHFQLYHNFGAIIFGEPRSFGANLTYRY